MRKGAKSLQNTLNEIMPKINTDISSVTDSAYSQARQKFKHTAFIELNQTSVVDVMYYSSVKHKLFNNFRVLAIDGSKIQLPDTNELKAEFGVVASRNGDPGYKGEHCFALFSALYDVLNKVTLDASLSPISTYEGDSAINHLKEYKKSKHDLAILDRGYCTYWVMASILKAGINFLIRCKSNCGIPEVKEMLKGDGPEDQIVTLQLPRKQVNNLKYKKIAKEIKVRLVRIKLNTGEYEVLCTSVLDTKKLSTADIGTLYHLRWQIETLYGILKTRLGLENFSGFSVEAIKQDVFSSILVTGLETILTEDAEDNLNAQKGGQSKKVNKAVSFNAIKNKAFELFMSDAPDDQVTEQLTNLFMTKPTIVRPDRNPTRKKRQDRRTLNWHKRKKKTVF